MTPAEAARFVEEHRSMLERAIAAAIKRHALSPEDAARLSERVDATLAADEYRIVRMREGVSGPLTFFTTLVAHLVRDLRSAWRERRRDASGTGTRQPISLETPSRRPAARAVSREQAVELRVVCADVVVGSVRLQRLDGLVSTTLLPTDAYDMIAPAARRLADRLDGVTRSMPMHLRPTHDEVAAFLADEWSGATLSLTTIRGEPTPAASVVVVDSSRLAGFGLPHWVVIDFRVTDASVPALVTQPVRPDGNVGPRPAA